MGHNNSFCLVLDYRFMLLISHFKLNAMQDIISDLSFVKKIPLSFLFFLSRETNHIVITARGELVSER